MRYLFLLFLISGLCQAKMMRVTAYCPCEKCCGQYGWGYVTASGYNINRKNDVLVAAPKSYKFGTALVIKGYNSGQPVMVKDRGGAIKGDRLDVYFPTHKEALKWGVRYIDVKILRSNQ